MTDNDLLAEAERLARLLTERGQRLAVAESCTGGWIAKVLTDIPGSSLWFERGFLTYSNASKQEMLGVPGAILHSAGAVSEQVVSAMASGALVFSPADFSLAVSGIAGPGGGSEEKPVGSVWLAWARRSDAEVITRLEHFCGDREEVRRQAVMAALTGLVGWLAP